MRDQIYYENRAKEIIKEIPYLTLATSSLNNIPWNTPVSYSVSKDFKFYFGSPKNTQHSKNIRENSNCFVVIYDSKAPDGEGEGVYMTATVRELSDDNEIQNALQVMFGDEHSYSIDNFSKESELRSYEIIPEKVWMNDAEEKDGLFYDFRVEIKLPLI